MATKVVMVASTKGGCGKSTVAILLASCLAEVYGRRVLMLDADIFQGTVKTWSERSEAAGVLPGGLSVTSYGDAAHVLDFIEVLIAKDQYDYILIDPVGTAGALLFALAGVSDFMVIPTAPSLVDLDGLRQVRRALVRMREQAGSAPGFNVVVNRVSNIEQRSARFGRFIEELTAALDNEIDSICESGLTDRLVYRDVAYCGTLYSMPRSAAVAKAIDEVTELTKTIAAQVGDDLDAGAVPSGGETRQAEEAAE